MYLHEAIRSRTAETPYISRTKWADNFCSLAYLGVKILPTDSPDCCIVQSKANRKGPCRGWQPTAEDLLADDWEPVR